MLRIKLLFVVFRVLGDGKPSVSVHECACVVLFSRAEHTGFCLCLGLLECRLSLVAHMRCYGGEWSYDGICLVCLLIGRCS